MKGQAMTFESPNPLAAQSARIPSQAVDLGLRRYMLRVYNLMAGGLCVTGLAAALASTSGFYQAIAPTPLKWLVLLGPLAIIIFLSFRSERISPIAAQAAFWGFAVSMGLSLAGIFLLYTSASIARAFFIAAATFGAMSLYGYTTERDLSGLSSFLLMGLIGILLAGLVNIFLTSTALQFVISAVGVLVCTGLTAYDAQRIKESYLQSADEGVLAKSSIMGALTLYLDFINLFLALLQLSGQRRD
jgi:uncharacterized protein